MLKLFLPVIVIAASACASTPESVPAPAQTPTCDMSEADRIWIERALEAWRFSSREITGISRPSSYRGIFFDAKCVLTSDDALSAPDAKGVTWSAAPHAGIITLPDGAQISVGVTSFASGKDGTYWFVMSTPSVWAASGVGEGSSLESTMIAVLLHEASHVAQLAPYGPRLGALIEQNHLPESFNDDVVQERFQTDADFAASVAHESKLLLEAAAKKDPIEAMVLAFEARELMRERAKRWFVGDDAYMADAEDLWLTFEGAGQWVAYQWQIHPQGGAKSPAEMLPRFTHGSSWSQTEGFAVVMALDRIVGPAWKRHAFGDGEQTVLQMLDAALAE